MLGYRFFNSYSFSGGGFTSGGSDEYDIGLVTSSLRGQSVDYILEIEPNNSIANAMPLDLPANVRGDALTEGDTFYGGWTGIVLSTIDEIEPNDSDAGAQNLVLPVMIKGTVSASDSGTITSSSPPGISTYQTSIEDWYHLHTERTC